MGALFTLLGQIILLIGVGLLLGRLKILGGNENEVLTNLILNLILPCNIYYSFSLGFESSLLGDIRNIIIASAGTQIFYILANMLIFRKGFLKEQLPSAKYSTICPNVAFIGAPIAEAFYGGPGLILSACYQLPYRVSMWSVGLVYYTGDFDKKDALKKMAANPCVLAVVLGFLSAYFDISLPTVIENSVGALSGCSTPISMVLTGMILAGSNARTLFNPRTVYHTVMRLIVIPAAVLGLSRLFGLRGLALSVNVLMAALPSGIVSVMLASRYRADEVFASSCVMLSTALSFATLPAWHYILNSLI